MGEVFSITTASGTIQLDAKRQGGANFSVTNEGGQALRARAEVVAQAPAQNDWFTIEGEAERSFPVGGTQAYQVEVAVPPTAATQTYRFRLDVLGTDDPDEDQAQGQWVDFSVQSQPAPPPARRIPWLWIIVAAAVVVVLAAAGVTAWVLTHRQGTLTPSTSTVNFGTVAVGKPATQAITIKDTGPAATTVNATIAGANATDFTVGAAACLGKTLDPNASCVIQVTFTPAGKGGASGSLQITGDHAGTTTVALTGTGGGPIATASPIQLTLQNHGDSGMFWVGGATIRNTGDTPLNVKSASVSFSNPAISASGVFIQDGCLGRAVAPSQTCSIALTIPAGAFLGTPPAGNLTVISDASPLTVPFT